MQPDDVEKHIPPMRSYRLKKKHLHETCQISKTFPTALKLLHLQQISPSRKNDQSTRKQETGKKQAQA